MLKVLENEVGRLIGTTVGEEIERLGAGISECEKESVVDIRAARCRERIDPVQRQGNVLQAVEC